MRRMLIIIAAGAILASCMYVEPVDDDIKFRSDASYPESSMAQISVELRSLPNSYGHTVKVNSVLLGGTEEEEQFHEIGTILLDSLSLNSTALSLPADYAPITDSCISVIPQDFSEVGLPVEVDFNVMEEGTAIMHDVLRTRVNADFRPGEKFPVFIDLSFVPITFEISIEDWFNGVENIEIVL